jgi:hypothetical protein
MIISDYNVLTQICALVRAIEGLSETEAVLAKLFAESWFYQDDSPDI